MTAEGRPDGTSALRHDQLVAQLKRMLDDCGKPGWDGCGARAVSPVAVRRAIELLGALPEDAPLPEACPEADGAISLDWIPSPDWMLSASVADGEHVAVAWVTGHEHGHDVVRFDGETVPAQLLDRIRAALTGGARP
jgi:hypothetical protein